MQPTSCAAPVAAAHGVVTTLRMRGDELTPGQQEDLRRVVAEQVERLATLVEQLLDLSRVEAGAVTIRPTRFAVRRRIEELVLVNFPERHAEVLLEVDPTLEFEADEYAFERVVVNLVDNGLRHGCPPVSIRGGLGGAALTLVVEDSGPGIDPELAPRLFESFARGPNAPRHGGGAGLGLAIARSYAQAQGRPRLRGREPIPALAACGRARGLTSAVPGGC